MVMRSDVAVVDAVAEPGTEHVVVVDRSGTPVTTVPKAGAHDDATPLHLAFSCHIVDGDGRVLLTRRASGKPTWPGAWTNGCCGHPQLGETLAEAAERRVAQELGLRVTALRMAVPDFAYRAAMADGTVEHELCPVLVVEVAGTPSPDPAEVGDLAWTSWEDLQRRIDHDPGSLSPWAVEQLEQLRALGPVNGLRWWLARPVGAADRMLHVPLELGRPGYRPARARTAGVDDPMAPVRAPLEAVLDDFLRARGAEVAAVDPLLADLAASVRRLVAAGGKRLRPAFVWWGHRATGADADDRVLWPAAALELLHTFALLHDDVMDRSQVRRNRPAAHVEFAREHARADRVGDARWFGTGAAILAGDLAHVWADDLLDAAALPPEAVDRARRVYSELRREVIAGQYLDLVLAGDPGASEVAARKVALLKSARYTVTRPLLLGAALGDPRRAASVATALRTYGDAVGLAFQLRDDVLGLFGDPAATGKSCVDDLREGKRTLLVLRALRLASPAQERMLRRCLGDPALDATTAAEAASVVAATGALASIESLLSEQHATAVEAAEGIGEPARRALMELADMAISRDA